MRIRQLKFTIDLSGQKNVNAQKIVAAQEKEGGVHADVRRQAKPDREDQDVDRVDRMIKVKAVSRPFDSTMSRQRSVKRIAEPVYDQAQARQEKEFGSPVACNVAQTGDRR